MAVRPPPNPHVCRSNLHRRHPLRAHPLRPRRVRHPAAHRLVDSSSPNARYAHATIFFLPGADGSLADSIATLAALHNVGLNVFAFDYRGYGQSATTRPNQQNMAHDADSAWQYLTNSRAIPAQQIIPYGTGVGASLAAQLAANHTTIPALILDAPHADLLPIAQRDPRARLLPVRLLFHEQFPLAAPLSTLKTPKLLLSRSNSPDQSFRTAADPKLTVELPSPELPKPELPSPDRLYAQSITRFLDQYVAHDLSPAPTQQLVPPPAPTH
ncbi:alpha/beta hydrolase [Tunturiibacter empetritectus]|uniref:alpha/beta hydrolase n=1 Tax=Tunturiibacter empetritectus TaxID=3069691 RepID=UPI003D9AD21D